MDNCEKIPKKVYRFFKEKSHAEDFIKGNVRLSTFKACRNYENEEQGDKFEASRVNVIKNIQGPYDSVIKSGFSNTNGTPINLGKDARIENLTIQEVIRDGYLFCTTLDYNPQLMEKDFGKYCVEISDPENFLKLIADKMRTLKKMYQIGMCNILYTTHEYANQNVPDFLVPFYKLERYKQQKEYRFLFMPEDNFNLAPFNLYVPEIVKLCKVIQ
jgi:hypothetical protein